MMYQSKIQYLPKHFKDNRKFGCSFAIYYSWAVSLPRARGPQNFSIGKI